MSDLMTWGPFILGSHLETTYLAGTASSNYLPPALAGCRFQWLHFHSCISVEPSDRSELYKFLKHSITKAAPEPMLVTPSHALHFPQRLTNSLLHSWTREDSGKRITLKHKAKSDTSKKGTTAITRAGYSHWPGQQCQTCSDTSTFYSTRR
eukprot:jgi/Botrbrau1/8128/Bobra.0308s0020.1